MCARVPGVAATNGGSCARALCSYVPTAGGMMLQPSGSGDTQLLLFCDEVNLPAPDA